MLSVNLPKESDEDSELLTDMDSEKPLDDTGPATRADSHEASDERVDAESAECSASEPTAAQIVTHDEESGISPSVVLPTLADAAIHDEGSDESERASCTSTTPPTPSTSDLPAHLAAPRQCQGSLVHKGRQCSTLLEFGQGLACEKCIRELMEYDVSES